MRLIDADALEKDANEDLLSDTDTAEEVYWNDGAKSIIDLIKTAPTIEPKNDVPCDFCSSYGLEDGDTLYISADWDGGVAFDYVRDIHYCPKCGRKLTTQSQ